MYNKPFLYFTGPFNSILLVGETKMYLTIDLKLYKRYLNESYPIEDIWRFIAKINATKLGDNLNKTEQRDTLKILLEKMEFSDFNIKAKSGRCFPVHKCIIGNFYIFLSPVLYFIQFIILFFSGAQSPELGKSSLYP